MKIARLIGLSLSLTAFAGAAHAQLVVKGKGDAALCYQYAITGNTGSKSAINSCTAAFSDFLTRKDEAATYVNRGVLYMRKGNQALAEKDYMAALAINPRLTEAHVNHGASLIQQEKYKAALSALNKALADTNSPTRPEALYNRAIILNHMEDYSGAYRDLQAALVIRPNWEPAVHLLEGYEVQPAG